MITFNFDIDKFLLLIFQVQVVPVLDQHSHPNLGLSNAPVCVSQMSC